MKRRTILSGLGALAAAGAAGIGTGAFDTVDADREVTVNVVEDSNAYVGLSQLSVNKYPNAEYVEDDDGENKLKVVDLNSNDADPDGKGVGLGAEYVFFNMFELKNQGTQSSEFAFEEDPDNPVTDVAPIDNFNFIDEAGNAVTEANPLNLDAGSSENIGVELTTASEDDISSDDIPDHPGSPSYSGEVDVKADPDGFD